ncbi:unnamed protein product [Cyprideis torosa]|uniref:Uncharacterized protein n=1 Tax=Cyprideis torosa TaxID=163714 RepID=A0A7R8WNR2_9CRUS|nr:unnamed protein product [Cyprideis torosa]CAG0899878.1 unnamed protein product [Cyprideis torosa]
MSDLNKLIDIQDPRLEQPIVDAHAKEDDSASEGSLMAISEHTRERIRGKGHSNVIFAQSASPPRPISEIMREGCIPAKPLPRPPFNSASDVSGEQESERKASNGTKESKSARRHACFVCGKSFAGKHSLNIHERTHTGENPFQCEFCKKMFSDFSNLTQHRRIHNAVSEATRELIREKPLLNALSAQNVSLTQAVSDATRELIREKPLLNALSAQNVSLTQAVSETTRELIREKPRMNALSAQNVSLTPAVSETTRELIREKPLLNVLSTQAVSETTRELIREKPLLNALSDQNVSLTQAVSEADTFSSAVVFLSSAVKRLGKLRVKMSDLSKLVDILEPRLQRPVIDAETKEEALTCGESQVRQTSLESRNAKRKSSNGTKESKSARRHACRVCGKSFAGKHSLNIHERKHTGEKPFQCEFCKKMFPRLGKLTQHRRSHSGERAFQCNVCLKRFSQSSDLRSH